MMHAKPLCVRSAIGISTQFQAARIACPNAEKANADKPPALRGSTGLNPVLDRFGVRHLFVKADRQIGFADTPVFDGFGTNHSQPSCMAMGLRFSGGVALPTP
jgi:hypothetical protein